MAKTKRKINFRPAKSVMDCVKEFASAHKTFTVNQVYEAYTDKPTNQIQTALWKMRNAGILGRTADGKGYTVLTDVNKPVEPKISKFRKPRVAKNVQTIESLRKQLEDASKEILHWNRVATTMTDKAHLAEKLNIQLEDALAIIRYLENKLYVALQMVAKNGGNS
jgi:hypothetical protein